MDEQTDDAIERRIVGTGLREGDVSAWRQAEQALREADRRKDEFLATLAHELRNPLAPIRNLVHVLRLAQHDGGVIERAAETIERQVRHLTRLVDDLLDASRISSGKVGLRRELVTLDTVLHGAIETARPAIDAARHTLAVDLPDEPFMLDADPMRLAQVFVNLLVNAAKYSEAGGDIRLSAGRDRNDCVRVSVVDSGIGIPADMLPRVFDLFAQVDRSLGRAQGGLGIGLALVRDLVRLHGGSTEVHSEGPGRGSEFVVRLPLAATPRRDDDEVGEPRSPRGDKPAAGAAPPLPRRALVVDDNRDAADSLGALLQLLGAETQVAYDGASALRAIGRRAPEVVLLDIGMPGMDGYEVARRIRAMPGLRGVTLVALTGWSLGEDPRRAVLAGFDHHLLKPIDIDGLRALLERG